MGVSKVEGTVLELYHKGWTDQRIADELEITQQTVYHIRKRHGGLPPNAPPPPPARKNTPPKAADDLTVLSWMAHRLGLSYGALVSTGSLDVNAARREYAEWRTSRHREKKPARPRPRMDQEKAAQLYEQGMSDAKIAAECGVGVVTVAHWRKKTGRQASRIIKLAQKKEQPKPEPKPREVKLPVKLVEVMYLEGKSDGEIARVFGAKPQSVKRLRDKMGWPSKYERKVNKEQ